MKRYPHSIAAALAGIAALFGVRLKPPQELTAHASPARGTGASGPDAEGEGDHRLVLPRDGEGDGEAAAGDRLEVARPGGAPETPWERRRREEREKGIRR